MDRHNVRKRVEPMRFGRKANKSDLSKSDSSNNLFCDDSQDDKNYTPEKKKRKTQNDTSDQELADLDLNSEFDQIQIYLQNHKESEQQSKSQEIIASNSNKSDASDLNTKTTSEQKKSVQNTNSCGFHCNNEIDTSLLSKLYKNSVEILARVSVIEETLMKNGLFKAIKSEKEIIDISHIEAFMKSNNLPLMSIEQLQTFESNLKNESFKKSTVSFVIVNNWYIFFHIPC